MARLGTLTDDMVFLGGCATVSKVMTTRFRRLPEMAKIAILST